MKQLFGCLWWVFLPLACAGGAAEGIAYRLVERTGQLVIESSEGERLSWACYGLSADISVDDWKQKVEPMVGAGIRLHQVNCWSTGGSMWDNPWFSPDGGPLDGPRSPISWEEQIPWLIERDPECRFVLRFGMGVDSNWRKANRDQFAPLSAPDVGLRDGYAILPSIASEVYLERMGRMIRDTVAWCEKQPWRDRVVGYTVFPFGEGTSEVALFDELFDTSPAMRDQFRQFLRKKYDTDAALRAAWEDGDATLAEADVPTRQQWLDKKRRLGLLHWPDPARVQRERDYFLLQKQLFHRFWTAVFGAMQEATAGRPVIKGYDILKQHMQGWQHNADFNGDWYVGVLDQYPHLLLASGSAGVAPLLDHPGLDVLQTPGMYFNRAVGYAWEAEGLSDALTLRGKLNFMEADMRTWVRKSWRGKDMQPERLINDAGTFLTPGEMRAGFRRALAWALSRNQMFYYMSVCGANWWFHEPEILDEVSRITRVTDRSAAWSRAETPHAICVVIDDDSGIYEDFSGGFQHLAVYRQIEEGLALCGVPYRIHLLADIEREDFPDYRCYLFPNLFRVDDRIEAVLRRKVLRDGNVAIFGPATGITDGTTLSGKGASRLLGVPMELIPSCARRVILQDHGHPISRGLGTQVFGDSHAYGPILVPTAQRLPAGGSATQLGAAFYFYFFDRPGLFVTDFGKGGENSGRPGGRGAGDYATVFSPVVPLPAELLRECARYAGCNVWSEKNAVVYASGSVVALHTVGSGLYTLNLPKPTAVWDVDTGRRLARHTDRIRMQITGPETRIFRLGR